MTNIEQLIFAAFRILGDMNVIKTAEGFVIIDVLMNGARSEPIADPRDVARIVHGYIIQDMVTINAAGPGMLAQLREAAKGGALEIAGRPQSSFGKTYS